MLADVLKVDACAGSNACTSTPDFTWNSPYKGELEACAVAVHKIGLLLKNVVQHVKLGEQGVDKHSLPLGF